MQSLFKKSAAFRASYEKIKEEEDEEGDDDDIGEGLAVKIDQSRLS